LKATRPAIIVWRVFAERAFRFMFQRHLKLFVGIASARACPGISHSCRYHFSFGYRNFFRLLLGNHQNFIWLSIREKFCCQSCQSVGSPRVTEHFHLRRCIFHRRCWWHCVVSLPFFCIAGTALVWHVSSVALVRPAIEHECICLYESLVPERGRGFHVRIAWAQGLISLR
jgi:hypothetical protein